MYFNQMIPVRVGDKINNYKLLHTAFYRDFFYKLRMDIKKNEVMITDWKVNLE